MPKYFFLFKPKDIWWRNVEIYWWIWRTCCPRHTQQCDDEHPGIHLLSLVSPAPLRVDPFLLLCFLVFPGYYQLHLGRCTWWACTEGGVKRTGLICFIMTQWQWFDEWKFLLLLSDCKWLVKQDVSRKKNTFTSVVTINQRHQWNHSVEGCDIMLW